MSAPLAAPAPPDRIVVLWCPDHGLIGCGPEAATASLHRHCDRAATVRYQLAARRGTSRAARARRRP